jgi:hypothetical protein
MFGRIGVALAGLFAVMPAIAGEMSADQARYFVVGKLFSFNCFDGTEGAGRIYNDGSAAGTVRFQGRGPVRYMQLPANSLRVKGDSVCASVKGLFFEPCFNLTQTDHRSFRGAIWGFGFAYCDFKRRDARTEIARAGSPPLLLRPSIHGAAGE